MNTTIEPCPLRASIVSGQVRTLPLILFLALTTANVDAFASTVDIQFTTLPANTENGTRNGFSSGTMDGLLFNNLICNDYSRITSFPSADLIYTVSSIDDLSLTRFGGLPDAQQKYEQAAVLVYALENLPLVNAQLSADFQITAGDLQYAIWNIFTPGSGNTAHSQVMLDFFNSENRYLNIGSSVYTSLRIYTPTAEFGSNQEFVQLQPVAPGGATQAPEPSAIVPMLGALLVAGSVTLRRSSAR
jgi:hypothetical protein